MTLLFNILDEWILRIVLHVGANALKSALERR
jgi:hypothetical protein